MNTEKIDEIISERLGINSEDNTAAYIEYKIYDNDFWVDNGEESISLFEVFEDKYIDNKLNMDILNKKDIFIINKFGGEDLGEEKSLLLKIIVDNESYFIKYYGYYNSWEGTEWNELDTADLMKPIEITKIKYIKVEK